MQAVVSGEVGIAITTPPLALGFLREDNLIGLAAGAGQRLASLPEVATLAEAGGPSDVLIALYSPQEQRKRGRLTLKSASALTLTGAELANPTHVLELLDPAQYLDQPVRVLPECPGTA